MTKYDPIKMKDKLIVNKYFHKEFNPDILSRKNKEHVQAVLNLHPELMEGPQDKNLYKMYMGLKAKEREVPTKCEPKTNMKKMMVQAVTRANADKKPDLKQMMTEYYDIKMI